ncbi:hypothetical protein FGB62_3g361 [Gracilaria domingensis]|nr:hypothetical protein FGB62_3g361 [Gracilaria domingensis]
MFGFAALGCGAGDGEGVATNAESRHVQCGRYSAKELPVCHYTLLRETETGYDFFARRRQVTTAGTASGSECSGESTYCTLASSYVVAVQKEEFRALRIARSARRHDVSQMRVWPPLNAHQGFDMLNKQRSTGYEG